jgi:hypothetical protein
MISPKTLLRSARILLFLATLVPSPTTGQQRSIGPTLSRIISSGERVARDCLQRGYSTGLGIRIATPILTMRTTLEVAGRGYWLAQWPTCVDGFPPPDGVYVEEDGVNLLSRPFVTTDVRLGIQLGKAPAVMLGAGNAWHQGHDLPYLLLAAALPLFHGRRFQLRLEGEYQWLRASVDRFRRTYQNFQVVAEEPMGRVRSWSHAATIGLHLGIPL